MKLSKLAFWRQRRASKRTKKGQTADTDKDSTNIEEPKTAKLPQRSSSFNGTENAKPVTECRPEKEQKKSDKVKRSRSLGHKTSRRNSFIRWFRISREIGKSLRKIGDELESNHSNSLVSINSSAR